MPERPDKMTAPAATDAATEMPTVVIVDDDEAVRDSLADYLQTAGWPVLQASDGAAALAIAENGRGDIFISDIRMPGMDGITLLRRLRERDPNVEVLITTGFSSEESAVEALKAGAFDYFHKPLNAVEVEAALQRTRRYRAVRLENERLRTLLTRGNLADGEATLVGESSAVVTLLDQLTRLAAAPSATVLLQGESGVGKEVAARLLHRLTRGDGAPFVAVNCGGLPESLLESELFGHERGAFTGANRQTAGVFELALGGTVLLDEISEMSVHAQSRFLRILEDRRLRRLGGRREVNIQDLRIIASTNRDLEAMVAAGDFREDLYYRLQVVTLTLPALRDRPADIMPLANHFAARYGARRERPMVFCDTAVAALKAHGFPGNVRELRNRVERASIFAVADEIGPLDLGLSVADDSARLDNASGSLNLAATERVLIQQALAQEDTHVGAARRLGISAQALYRKMEKHGIRSGGD